MSVLINFCQIVHIKFYTDINCTGIQYSKGFVSCISNPCVTSHNNLVALCKLCVILRYSVLVYICDSVVIVSLSITGVFSEEYIRSIRIVVYTQA